MDSHVRVSANGSNTSIEYPPWKARKLDKQFLGQSSTLNPMPSAFEGVLGSEVRGERGVHGVFDDSQDNAANSCAIVVLVNMSGEPLPAYTPVFWNQDSDHISRTASIRKYNEDDKVGRMMSVVNPFEKSGRYSYGSVTMHPRVYHETKRFGITQADVKVSGTVAVGIQHYSQICVGKDFATVNAGDVLEIYDIDDGAVSVSASDSDSDSESGGSKANLEDEEYALKDASNNERRAGYGRTGLGGKGAQEAQTRWYPTAEGADYSPSAYIQRLKRALENLSDVP